ncbi:MAG: amidohydrolase family protein [Actinobacteria bacterium]|nr:amidohydrolase family protein [Actinomycetota bacterium]
MITVYRARLIHTLDNQLPTATAVAVRDGRILGVGTTVEELQPWLDTDSHEVDERYADQVLVPGFIDPHLHPMLPALLMQFPFIAPERWQLPTGDFPGVTDPDGYWAALTAAFARHDSDDPFITWGYSAWFHGPMARAALDERLSADHPVVVWDRSFHAVFVNSAGLKWLGISGPADLPDLPGVAEQVDLEKGHFFEGGLAAFFPKVQQVYGTAERVSAGFQRFAEMVRAAGVTTVADMALGILAAPELELALQQQNFEDPAVGFRVVAVPNETSFLQEGVDPEAALGRVESMVEQTQGRNVEVSRHFKLFADGAFFSQGFRLCSPGYLDGHEGEWVAPPAMTTNFAHTFWDAGYQLHVHVNGDDGARFCLDLAAECFERQPRLDHRFTLEHWGFATEEQNRRAAALGCQVSMQPNYTHVLGDVYRGSLGADRVARLSGAGTAVSHGLPLALHSDCPMAPIDPIGLMRTAVTRRTLAGNVVGAGECLTPEQALRAVTIDAAWILRMEDELGSVRAGKRADFTVLDQDPLQHLDTVSVVGSVFAGTPVA